MLEHQANSHEGIQNPQFNFKVVKRCKTSLERQVREAVSIQMIGNVLNKKKCSLRRWAAKRRGDDTRGGVAK